LGVFSSFSALYDILPLSAILYDMGRTEWFVFGALCLHGIFLLSFNFGNRQKYKKKVERIVIASAACSMSER